MLDLTVVIPTYNGASKLPKVLEKLRSQTGIENLSWEIIIVDNNSSDDTGNVVQDYQSKFLASVPIKYFLETKQGAAFARLRGVREASGELIAFLDDDIILAPDWLAAAWSFCQGHSLAGAVGGQIHGDYEVKPPEGFENIQQFLAIREHGSNPYRFDAKNLRLPPTASLIVRKQAWRESVPERPTLTGKLPGLLVQGDDYEPLLYIHKAGWEIWYNPDMHVYHQIPRQRLEKKYLLALARGCGLATCTLRMINTPPWQKPIVFTRTLLGNLRRIVRHLSQYRGQAKSELIPAVELEFFWGSFMSPFFYLNRNIKKDT